MIDQAKHNLARPVKFKFSGIYSKYVDGLRKREQSQRAKLEGKLQLDGLEEESKERSFAQMSERDQVDEVIMKYIFMRPENS